MAQDLLERPNADSGPSEKPEAWHDAQQRRAKERLAEKEAGAVDEAHSSRLGRLPGEASFINSLTNAAKNGRAGGSDEAKNAVASNIPTPHTITPTPAASKIGRLARARGFVKARVMRNRRLYGGGIVGLLVMAGFSFFSLLGPLQLQHLLSNVDASAFESHFNIMSRRSSKWVDAYIQLRLLDDGTGETYIRADRVDNNDPLTDWYKTSRTSKLEDDLFRNDGIVFSSLVDTEGNVKPAVIKINGLEDTVISPEFQLDDGRTASDVLADFKKTGKLDGMNELTEKLGLTITEQLLENDKDGRKFIANALDEATNRQSWMVRRYHRANIQNMTGIRNWRIFEGSRDSIDAAQRRMLARVSSVVLRPFGEGGILGCLLGSEPCKTSNDVADPNNRQGARADGDIIAREDNTQQVNNDGTLAVDENGDPIGDSNKASRTTTQTNEAIAEATDEFLDGAPTPDGSGTKLAARIATKVAGKALGALNLMDTLDTVSHLHKAIQNGAISKSATVIKLATFTAGYASANIIAEQLQSGDDVSGDEANAAINLFQGAAQSNSYQFLYEQDAIASSGAIVQALGEQAEFEYETITEGELPNADTNGSKFEDAYNNSVGQSIGVFVSAYDAARGSLLGRIAGGVLDIFNGIQEAVVSAGLRLFGIDDDVERLVGAVSQKALEASGATPYGGCLEAGPGFHNCTYVGGVSSAESANRNAGGALATPQVRTYIDTLNEEQRASNTIGWYENLTNIGNPETLAARTLVTHNPLAGKSLGDNLRTVASWLNPMRLIDTFSSFGFGSQSVSANDALCAIPESQRIEKVRCDNPQTPAEFAGVEQYGFPEEVLEQNPLTMNLQTDCHNAFDIPFDGDPLTFSTEELFSADLFYGKIYKSNKYNVDDIKRIWNICIADAQIMASMTEQYRQDSTSIDEELFSIDSGNGGRFSWDIPFDITRVMVKDTNSAGNLIQTEKCGQYCYEPAAEAEQHAPVDMNVELIFVEEGARLHAPSSWDCPAEWACNTGTPSQVTVFSEAVSSQTTEYAEPTSLAPTNLVSPINYITGNAYMRIDVQGKPSSKQLFAQPCFWRNNFSEETCGDGITFTDEGVYYLQLAPPCEWWVLDSVLDPDCSRSVSALSDPSILGTNQAILAPKQEIYA